MSFGAKWPRDLCILFKRTKASGALFVRHIEQDELIVSAFRGDRALDRASQELVAGFAIEKPPGTHQQLIAQAKDWANAVGAGWSVMPDCGCKVTGTAWEGTVTAVFEIHTPVLGRLIETDTATVRFEIDSSLTTPGDPAEYWKSTSGAIKWQTSATGGQCTGGASGTVPIGLGSDLNPMAGLRLEVDGSGVVRFSASIGPWPEQYSPRIKYTCKNEPPGGMGLMPLIAATEWWGHDPANAFVSYDGTLSGTYKTALGGGTMEWRWDFRLVP